MLRILDKPAGLTTHTSLSADERRRLSVDPVDSFLGSLTSRSGVTLWPVHRLDLGTTGVLLAADTADEAAELSKAFESRDIEKTYYFLTDGRLIEAETGGDEESHVIRVESFIDRHSSGGKGSNFFSREGTTDHPVNAITTFELVEQRGVYALWRARPLTGRPHQIRLHAESLGIPILGDGEHGGSVFPTICLHAAHVRFSWRDEVVEASSPMPRWFSDLSLITRPLGLRLINWIAAVERRERLWRSIARFGVSNEFADGFLPRENGPTVRLIHGEGQGLRADLLGSIVHFHWYDEVFSAADQKVIEELAALMGWNDWYIQTRANRGKQPTEAQILLSRPDLPVRWNAREESMTFAFRRDTSMSAGLFLDQRANRRWVQDQAKGLRVLNLFSYTSGFSVAAAKGQAAKVVSVDLSKNFLNWSKENFVLNGLGSFENDVATVVDPRYEFRAMEARDYLKWAKKKELQFDLVICDPPSFARTDAGVFRIEAELENLFQMCLDVTAPKGRVLFSTNYELFDEAEFFERALDFARRSKRLCSLDRPASPDLDFEFPREPRAMKCLFLNADE